MARMVEYDAHIGVAGVEQIDDLFSKSPYSIRDVNEKGRDFHKYVLVDVGEERPLEKITYAPMYIFRIDLDVVKEKVSPEIKEDIYSKLEQVPSLEKVMGILREYHS